MTKRNFWTVIIGVFWPIMTWATQAVNSRGTPCCPDSAAASRHGAANGIQKTINHVIESLQTIAGPIAVLVVLYAAYLLITSAGSDTRVKKAWHTLMYVIIGLMILSLSGGVVGLVKSILGR